MLRVGEESNLGDDGGHERVVAGVEPIASALVSICSDDDSAGNTVIRQAAIKDTAVHCICHVCGKLNTHRVAVKGAFVGYEPRVRLAVEVEEDDSSRLAVQRIVGAEYADSHAVGVVI